MRASGAGFCRLRKWSGRLKCGLTLRELGKEAGGMSIPGVAKACERMLIKLKTDRTM